MTFMNGIRYPCFILDDKIIESISHQDQTMCNNIPHIPYHLKFSEHIASARAQTPFADPNMDTYNVEHWWSALYISWSSHFVAANTGGNEAELRNGTDNLFRLAFERRSEWKHHFKAERDLYLPASGFPFHAKCDTLVTMTLPGSWSFHLQSFTNSHIFASELYVGDVVTFVAEAKCALLSAAERQLTLDLCSAQNQRRTLGFDDGNIFGATVVKNILRMYSSSWIDDIVTRTAKL